MTIVFPIGNFSLWPPMVSGSIQEIGAFVRARRRANNLTQRELGELAGVGTRFVSELERGKESVRVAVVNRVLRVFGKHLGIVEAARGDDPK